MAPSPSSASSLPSLTARAAATALVVSLLPLGFAAWLALDYVQAGTDAEPLAGLAAFIAAVLAGAALLGVAVAGGGMLLRHRAPRTGLGLATAGLAVSATLTTGFVWAFLT